MHWKLMFPSAFLGAEDLQGKDVALTIRRVIVEELQGQDGRKEKRACCYFAETKARAEKSGTPEKKMILNRTNAKVIAKLHGTEVDAWAGKRITLFPTTTLAFGETKDCIRIRETIPATDPAVAPVEAA